MRLQVQLHLRSLRIAPSHGQVSLVGSHTTQRRRILSSVFKSKEHIVHQRLRLPVFSHVFERDGACALYSSLNLKPVFIDPTLLPFVRKFEQAQDVSEFLAECEDEQQERMEALLRVLAEHKILVNAEATDDEILAYFQDLYTGHPYVSIAYFLLTDACNFGCKYCFVENRMGERPVRTRMTSETIQEGLAFFERLIRLKPEFFEDEKTIVIYGGEPLLNPQGLRVLLEEVETHKRDGRLPAKTEVSMVTNATLVTQELADLLAHHKVNVAVSIDGSPEATDEARQFKNGQAVSSAVRRGYDLLKATGVNVGISCTLGARSIEDFDETIDAVRELGASSLGFNIVLSGRDYQVPADYDERASRFILYAFERFRQENIFEDRVMRKVDAFIDGKIYPFDCGATGGGQIVIAPDGAVGLCHGYMGDRKTFTTHVEDEHFDPSANQVFLEWARRSPLNMDACRDCPALGICGGGCPLNADTELGSIWELDERFCVHATMTLEWLIWDLHAQMQTA